ncbi:Peptidase inhibitor 16 [Schistosoma japonicum]|nr:Peptidase inhibitor 16 [Schistosoma japonicum]
MIIIIFQSISMYLFYISCIDCQSTTEERILFEKHVNDRRLLAKCKVPGQPKPINPIGELSWDEELAELASRQVAACNLSSQYNKEEVERVYGDTVGINTADNADITNAVDNWFNEYKLYDYKTNTCLNPEDCLHYKRMVWDKSEFMGCSVGGCTKPEIKTGQIIVCYYSPMTSVKDSQPYKEDINNPCPPPQPETTTIIVPTTKKIVITTEKLKMGPYGRYRCKCTCKP